MEFIDLCKKRFSLRKYDPQRKIASEELDKCFEAARLAPSACNSQPWKFVAVTNREKITDLAYAAFSGLYSMNIFARDSSAIVAVVTEKSKYAARLGGFLRGTQFALIDIGIACEHLVLQASELGIGSCYFGWFNERKVKKTLSLPRTSRIDLLISLGYPLAEFERIKKRKELNEIRKII